MRVKQPEQFDPEREYKPGERAVYRGLVVVTERWTNRQQKNIFQKIVSRI